MRPLTPDGPPRIGRYRLLARLGHGGVGMVYLARSPDDRLCALKVVLEEWRHDLQFRAGFSREVRVARSVSSPFAPALLDADTDGDTPWMAAEYVPGLRAADAVPGKPSPGAVDGAAEAELEGWIYEVGFSADEEALYVFGMNTLSVWDRRTGEPVDAFEPVPSGAGIGDDGHVAATYADLIRVWHATSDNEAASFGRDNQGRGYCDMPALTSDGSRVAVLAAENAAEADPATAPKRGCGAVP
ncbi:hypothetical protein [Nocardiopsis sp. FR4]|uniref:hypothetical protein n=1 Tax=Nocardiopsis sp. FR4 TaxID=2605985 RepID=UPI001358E67A|nr:hypothetical protein [Nocardiopsis sp. FR4]